jgi:GTP-binding protein HflX
VRSRSEIFTVGLVGYTNAGKSTLLNRLTGADEFVADMPFATLDTRTRQWKLADGRVVLLSDTVGFVQRLPHHLVASFHATLEEALAVDCLLHVVDAAHPDAAAQVSAVEATLASISSRSADVLVLNKLDLVQDPIRLQLLHRGRGEEVVYVSARTGEGLQRLGAVVAARLDARSVLVEAHVAAGDGRSIAALKAAGTVLDERVEDDATLVLRLRILEIAFGTLASSLGQRVRFRVIEPAREPFFKGDSARPDVN